MKALKLVAPRTVRVADVPDPAPAPDEVVVKVLACGICGSDLNAWLGAPGIEYPLPAGAPGHEVWGEVVSVGINAEQGSIGHPLQLGELVTGLFSAGFAEYATAPFEHVLPVPSALSGHRLLGEPLACAMGVVRRAQVGPRDQVAVAGFGFLAGLIMRLQRPAPRRWIAVTRREESRQQALALGAMAAYGYDSVPQDAWDSFDVVIEAAGAQQSLDFATWLTRERGRLVIAGYHADGPRTVNMQSWNWKGLDVVNAHEREPRVYMANLRAALELVEREGLKLDGLITHEWPLAQAEGAFAAAEHHPSGYVKGVIRPWT